MNDVAVIGAGIIRYGKFPERTFEELGVEACVGALEAAGVAPRQIEAFYCGNADGGITPGQARRSGPRDLRRPGLEPGKRLRHRLDGLPRGLSGRAVGPL